MDNRVQELLAELERERRLREAAEAEAKKVRDKERILREAAEAAEAEAKKEREQREKAEALSEPTTLLLFLRACHELFLAIRIVTDPTKTTKGPVTKPTNRTVPSLIKIWDSFNDEQTVVWQTLNSYPSFLTEKFFPSKHQLDYVRQRIAPITSEWDLRYYERDTVENQVQDIVDKITQDKALRDAFGLRGSVTFESHTNMGHPEEDLPSEGDQQNPSRPVSETKSPVKKKRKNQKSMEKPAAVTTGQADRFCIYRQDGSEHIPAIAIEYKAPHKLTKAEMDRGLIKEIQPAKDVINQESDDVEFCCRRLVAAVITQLFSYMVRKGVRYGYVCTGEAFIFVHILDDPSSVQCALCIPNLNVEATDDSDSQLTAVAQVLAFTVIALKSPPVSQQWHDAASRLDVWPVEYSEILEQTPPASRLKNSSPLYRGRRPRDLPPFKMSLRSGGGGCRPSECDRQSTNSPSPPPPSSPSFAPSRPARTGRGGSVQPGKPRGAQGRGKPSDTHQTSNVAEPPAIKTRPYCSQKCLLALRDGGPFDPSCPSYQDHQKGQINVQEFCSRMQTQLATDRGPDADCRPLYKAGSCGALFKVRLSSHGYTLVAKGVEYRNRHKLEHEMRIYNRLQDLQGEFVPVCLGVVQLVSGYPYYYDEGIYTHMLFLSWAGEPVQKSTNASQDILSLVSHALRSIHSKGVLHGDAELRNILWNPTCKRPMIVDFERATVRHALSDVPGNATGKRRRRVEETGFSKEIERIEAAFGRYVA